MHCWADRGHHGGSQAPLASEPRENGHGTVRPLFSLLCGEWQDGRFKRVDFVLSSLVWCLKEFLVWHFEKVAVCTGLVTLRDTTCRPSEWIPGGYPAPDEGRLLRWTVVANSEERSHPPYCCASFPCDSGLRSSLSTFSVSPLFSTGGFRFFFPFPWWRFGTLGFQRNCGGGVHTRAADVVWWWCVDGTIQRDASQQLVYSFPVLYWFVASRQLCWLRRKSSVGVRCHGRDSFVFPY